MFKGLTLMNCLKFATGVWIINLMVAWIIDIFKD